MVQLRIMSDDQELGQDVLDILLPLLQACTALHAGEPTRLSHRGGGLRVVLDVQPAGAGPVRVEREEPASSYSGTGRRPRAALPRGGRRPSP